MGGYRTRPQSAPVRQKPQDIDREAAEKWFQSNVPNPSATGQLSAYMTAPVQKGMCNPPCNERVRQELLEYLLQNGIECEVRKTHLSTTLPDGVHQSPASAETKLTKSTIKKQRPKSASSAVVPQSHQKRPSSVKIASIGDPLSQIGRETSFASFVASHQKRPSSATVVSMSKRHDLPENDFPSRTLSPSKNSETLNRPLSAELQSRREKRIEECRGDLGNKFSMPRDVRQIMASGAGKKRGRATSTASFYSQRPRKDTEWSNYNSKGADWNSSLLHKSHVERNTREATHDLKVQSRLHRFEIGSFTDEELGDLNMFHNCTMRDINPSKLRTGSKWESCSKFPPSPSSRDCTPTSHGPRRSRGSAPSPWKRDTSAYSLVSLQARVGYLEGEKASSVNWIMRRESVSRMAGRSLEEHLTNQSITRMLATGDNSPGAATVQRYTPAELDRMQQERDLSPCQLLVGENAKKAKMVEGVRGTLGQSLRRMVTEATRAPDFEVVGEEVSSEVIARNEEVRRLAKKYDVHEALVEALRAKFEQLDTSSNGILEFEEFKALVKWLAKDDAFTDQMAQKLWAEFDGCVDRVQDGGISFEEFLVWCMRKLPNFVKMTATQLKHYMADLR